MSREGSMCLSVPHAHMPSAGCWAHHRTTSIPVCSLDAFSTRSRPRWGGCRREGGAEPSTTRLVVGQGESHPQIHFLPPPGPQAACDSCVAELTRNPSLPRAKALDRQCEIPAIRHHWPTLWVPECGRTPPTQLRAAKLHPPLHGAVRSPLHVFYSVCNLRGRKLPRLPRKRRAPAAVPCVASLRAQCKVHAMFCSMRKCIVRR